MESAGPIRRHAIILSVNDRAHSILEKVYALESSTVTWINFPILDIRHDTSLANMAKSNSQKELYIFFVLVVKAVVSLEIPKGYLQLTTGPIIQLRDEPWLIKRKVEDILEREVEWVSIGLASNIYGWDIARRMYPATPMEYAKPLNSINDYWLSYREEWLIEID
jgi:hypothetical protein